jgi:hypothetical protein
MRLIRLSITRLGDETEYFTLADTKPDAVKKMIEQIVVDQKISPFTGGKKTSCNIREAIGGKNLKSTTVSFYGISPKEIADLIKAYIKKHYSTTKD